MTDSASDKSQVIELVDLIEKGQPDAAPAGAAVACAAVSLEDVEDRINTLLAPVWGRISALEKSVGQLSGQAPAADNGLAGRVAALEQGAQRLDDLQQTVAALAEHNADAPAGSAAEDAERVVSIMLTPLFGRVSALEQAVELLSSRLRTAGDGAYASAVVAAAHEAAPTAVTDMSERVARLEGALAVLEEQSARRVAARETREALDERLADMTRRLAAMEGLSPRMDELASRLEASEDGARLDAVSERMEALEAAHDEDGARIEERLEARLADMARRLAAVEGLSPRVDELASRLDGSENGVRLDAVSERVKAIAGIEERLQETCDRLAALETRLDAMEARPANAGEGLAERLNSLVDSVAALSAARDAERNADERRRDLLERLENAVESTTGRLDGMPGEDGITELVRRAVAEAVEPLATDRDTERTAFDDVNNRLWALNRQFTREVDRHNLVATHMQEVDNRLEALETRLGDEAIDHITARACARILREEIAAMAKGRAGG